MPRPKSAADRFLGKVNKTVDCWLWTGSKSTSGYGRFKVASYTVVSAHRWSYGHHIGPIPEGLTIDHLCRTPACVNPEHLEAVTQAENNARVPRPDACPSGHEFTADNTAVQGVGINRGRRCKTCDRDRKRARRAALRSAV